MLLHYVTELTCLVCFSLPFVVFTGHKADPEADMAELTKHIYLNNDQHFIRGKLYEESIFPKVWIQKWLGIGFDMWCYVSIFWDYFLKLIKIK